LRTLPHMNDFQESRLRSHLLNVCKSVKVSLAIVRESQAWKPVYFLAEYDYLPPEGSFKILLHTSQFRIISGRIQMIQWQGFEEQVRNGGKLTVSLEGGETLAIAFAAWDARKPVLSLAWSRGKHGIAVGPIFEPISSEVRTKLRAVSGRSCRTLWPHMRSPIPPFLKP